MDGPKVEARESLVFENSFLRNLYWMLSHGSVRVREGRGEAEGHAQDVRDGDHTQLLEEHGKLTTCSRWQALCRK